MARAMATGSWARLMADATSTPSQPSSIACATSDGTPTPASRITGTSTAARSSARIVRVADSQAAPDGCPEGHDRRTAHLLEASGHDRVVSRVREHDEPVLGQLLGRREQLHRVGQQGSVVADDLELHPVRLERCPSEPSRQHGLGGRSTPRGVREDPDGATGKHVEQRTSERGIEPPNGDRGHGRARRFEGFVEYRHADHPTSSEQEAGVQGLARDDQRGASCRAFALPGCVSAGGS